MKVYFSYEHGDLESYPDIEALVTSIEKVDAENGEYLFWDDEGNEYIIDIKSWPRFLQKISPDILSGPITNLGHERIKKIMANYCVNYCLNPANHELSSLAEAIFTHQHHLRK